jgi:hypothetical protein
MTTWKNRRSCTSVEEATEALADCAVTEASTIIEGDPESAFILLGRVKEFAESWEIPFDMTAMLIVSQEYVENDTDELYAGWLTSYC